MRPLRFCIPFAFAAVLAACTGPAEPVWAPDDAVRAARYVHDGPPRVTLFTVINKRNGTGGHAGLMINGDERIMFDPAGTFSLPFVPERNDVHFGITERALAVYVDYHARETWDVRIQELDISAEQARMLAASAKAYGAVPKAQCALSVSRILKDVPGFESVGTTWYPMSLSADFAALPGVRTRLVTDDDADKNHNVLFEASRAGG